eukprot:751897-Hanusia_phi.AAC.3
MTHEEEGREGGCLDGRRDGERLSCRWVRMQEERRETVCVAHLTEADILPAATHELRVCWSTRGLEGEATNLAGVMHRSTLPTSLAEASLHLDEAGGKREQAFTCNGWLLKPLPLCVAEARAPARV